ncbi:MAG: DUF86 domain-containing protein [Burkholderiales bacterium]|nr:DUF86 domain-containing protein [Burkholderiales bacterium]
MILAKAAAIERAVARAREEWVAAGGTLEAFAGNITRLDAATLNVQRACESAIDLAQHVVHRDRLGAPGSARELFDCLKAAGVIEPALAVALKKMVGFRNIAVHEYQRLDPAIIAAIIVRDLDELLSFARSIVQSRARRSDLAG